MSKPKLVVFLILGLNLSTVSRNAFAQSGCLDSECLLLVPVAMSVLYIVMLIWVAMDAKTRGMDDIALWVIAVFLIGFGGLVLYFIFRPKGMLTVCPHCRKKRLRSSTRCPHCRRE